MDVQKQPKKRRFRSFISRNRKKIVVIVVILLALGLTAAAAYKAGVKQGTANAKSKAGISTPLLTNLKDAAKKASEKAKEGASTATSSSTSSSGFFRLSGTVQTNKNKTVSIKLGDGSVISLTVSDKAKFYSGSPRTAKPIADLKTGTAVFAIGTIGANGTFTANNIQAQK